jgi:hypothetical protein
MTTSTNGHQEGTPFRRVRFDDLASTIVRQPAGGASLAATQYSGRKVVMVAGVAFLALWGILYLIFREWRAHYRERARFGAAQVATAIDPLADIVPPGVKADEWQAAVRQTHAMVVTVTGSNLLDLSQMQSLRTELEQTCSRARANPATARDELAEVWNAVTDRAGFVLKDGRSVDHDRHPRPAILPARPEKTRPRAPAKPNPTTREPATRS